MSKIISSRPVPLPQAPPGPETGTSRPVQDPRLEAYLDGEQQEANRDFAVIIEHIIEKARKGNSGKSSRVQALDKPSTPNQKPASAASAEAAASISSARQEVLQVSGAADKLEKLGEDKSRARGLMEYM